VGERRVELLDEDVTDVAPDPFLEYLHEELSILVGADRPVCDEITLLSVEGAVTVPPSPAGLGEWEQLSSDPFDDGDELDELRA
jgi:hypothetical protein